MPTDDDYSKDPDIIEAVNRLVIRELGKELDGAHKVDDPHHSRLRAAAVEICARAGVLEVLKAVSTGGVLRPPPMWPQADIVPVAGGPGWMTVHIRAMTSHGQRHAEERIKIQGKPTQQQLANAFDRGYFRLRRSINKG